MAETGNGVKRIFLRGVEALGRQAASLADRAGERLREINVRRQMDEVRQQVADAAEEAFVEGHPLPEKLTILLSELNRLKETCKAQENAETNEETKEPALEEEMPEDGNEN